MQDVFEVVEASQISADHWLVRGRAWQTIKVGDTVYSAVGRMYRMIIEKDAAYGIPVETDIAPTPLLLSSLLSRHMEGESSNLIVF